MGEMGISDKKERRVEIKAARRELEKAQRVKCECSVFTLDYEGGCQCERATSIENAKNRLELALES
jgi:ribosomal protein L25 (general stress protein Ctc)